MIGDVGNYGESQQANFMEWQADYQLKYGFGDENSVHAVQHPCPTLSVANLDDIVNREGLHLVLSNGSIVEICNYFSFVGWVWLI